MTVMPRSLNARVLSAAGAMLVVFLGVAGFAIDHVFRETAMASVQDRLKAQIFMLLSLANLDEPAVHPLPDTLPNPSLAVPDSGQYAQIFSAAGDPVWRSRSMLGLGVQQPPTTKVGQFSFQAPISSAAEPLFCLSYAVEWETRGKAEPTTYEFQVCEARKAYDLQIQRFRRSLWGWFGGLAALMLLVQTLILRWGLRPLRQVAVEVRAIEAGRQSEITGAYPRELRALTRNLNALITARDFHVQRYRNALGDLAHSLKTPLAVIRSQLEGAGLEGEARKTVQDQVAQIDDTVRYQLQRAATVGRHAFAPPLEAAPVLERIAGSLRKVYHARALDITTTAEADALFYGDQGDLMEVVGNLADNACKWARAAVAIAVRPLPRRPGQNRPALEVSVHDDGPGMPAALASEVLRRGLRLDESAEGQGIGLSVVRDVVEGGYGGTIRIDSAPGNTCITVVFEFD
jgi:two-component system sensor histidine kinase PhoQ